MSNGHEMIQKTLPLPLGDVSARFSPDRVYRYELLRRWGDGQLVQWIMLNPSTADEVDDDPTVRRCIGFSKRWGFSGLVVCNIFAFRSTDPKVLKNAADPVGPDNVETILRVSDYCSKTVCGWGTHGSLGGAGRGWIKKLREAGITPYCLGTTKSGHPRHPLYVSYSQELVEIES